MYKIMETSITQHIMLNEAIFALSVFIYNFEMWYAPHIHTK